MGTSGGSIIASYATASVTGGTGNTSRTGGLVGWNGGSIIASYATASVTGGAGANAYTGGLVGHADSDITINASYATGSVTGGAGANAYTGGLVGYNDWMTVNASYATGSVTGGDNITGGLVGYNYDTVRNSHFDSTVNAALNAIGFNSIALPERQMFLERRLLSCRLRQPTAQQATRCTMNGTEI